MEISDKLRNAFDKWHQKTEKNKIISSESNNTSSNDIKYISTECDNDNGMTLYDHLYNQ